MPNRSPEKKMKMLRLQSCIRSCPFRHGLWFASEEWDLASGIGHVSGPWALAAFNPAISHNTTACIFTTTIHSHRLGKLVLVITLATWRSGLFHVTSLVGCRPSRAGTGVKKGEDMHVSTEVAEVPAHSSLRIEGTMCQRTQAFHTIFLLQEEQKNLNTVVERCLAKMEIDSRERPFLDACLEGVKS